LLHAIKNIATQKGIQEQVFINGLVKNIFDVFSFFNNLESPRIGFVSMPFTIDMKSHCFKDN
jgi:hypothetical protein